MGPDDDPEHRQSAVERVDNEVAPSYLRDILILAELALFGDSSA
jgi:hypothetical protein